MRITRKAIGFGALIIVVMGLVALLGVGLANREPVTGRSGFTRVGKPAPEFTLSLFEGGEVDLASYHGKPVVINFWSSTCFPCRQEAPILERLWQSYQEMDVQFIGVDIQDSEADGLRYLREFGITYPNGLDTDGKIRVDYGIIGIPVTFFVNRQGIVARRWVGAVSETRMTEWVRELAGGDAPTGEVEAENLEGFRTLN